MLARMSSSLTAAGPTCLISIREIFDVGGCPKTGVSRAKSKIGPHRQSGVALIIAWSGRHVFVAYFGRDFKSRIGLQKRQVDIAGRSVALLGEQQIDRHRFFFRTAAAFFILAA